jgi:hypothetical protein
MSKLKALSRFETMVAKTAHLLVFVAEEVAELGPLLAASGTTAALKACPTDGLVVRVLSHYWQM